MMHGSNHLYIEVSVRKSILCLPELASYAEAYLETVSCIRFSFFFFGLHTQHLPFVKHSSEVLTALKIFLNSSLTQSFLG